MLGKDGEAPPLFPIGNHHAIVGEQLLDMGGELRQKAGRFEGLLHGVPDRRQHGKQGARIGVHPVFSIPIWGTARWLLRPGGAQRIHNTLSLPP